MSAELTVYQQNLPSTIDDLAKFVLIGREKLVSVRAAIRAIEKVKLAEEVRQQKLVEAQDIADAVLDAEVRIGELTSRIPKAGGGEHNPNGVNQHTKNKVKKDTAVHFDHPPKPTIAEPIITAEDEEIEPDDSSVKQAEYELGEVLQNNPVLEEMYTIERKPEPEPVVIQEPPVKPKSEVIKEAGFTEKQVQRFEQLARHPEMVEAAKAEARQNGDIVTRASVLDKIKKEERKQNIQKQVEKIESGVETPDGLFDVIAIDPPWNYGTQYSAGGRRVANPYPEMTQQQLLDMEIPAAENCVMFLWTTHKFIWDAKALMDKWGFEYRSMIVWDKEKIGMGDLFRMQCEFCLVGIKGRPIFRDNHSIRDIIREPRREHSRKPDAFYSLVDSLCAGRKLDFFSREQRDGWFSYGNDTEKF